MTEPLWRGLTHQQVWDQVHAGPGPYVSDGAATTWRNAESALRQIDNDLSAASTKAAGWTGTAADAARSGLTPLGSWAVDAAGSAGRAAASLTEHQVQVAWVRANLPEPIASSDPAGLPGATATVGRTTALADQAFHVMDTYAANTTVIQQRVPLWTAPPAVTVSVAEGPPPGKPAASPQRVAGSVPAAVAPASAPAHSVAPGAVGLGVAQHPAGAAADGVGHLPPTAVTTVTPPARGSAEPPLGGRASRGRSAFPVLGGQAGRLRPDGSDVLPAGGLHGAAQSTRRGPGSLDGPGARTGTGRPGRAGRSDAHTSTDHPSPGGSGAHTGDGHPGPAREDDGVLRGVPSGRPDPSTPTGHSSSALAPPHLGLTDAGAPGSGVLGGGLGPGYPGSGRDGAGFGGRSVDAGPGPAGSRADAGTSVPSTSHAPTRTAPISTGADGNPGYLPAAGVGRGHPGDTHRRPDYLVGASALFADDRILAGPLITPEAPPHQM